MIYKLNEWLILIPVPVYKKEMVFIFLLFFFLHVHVRYHVSCIMYHLRVSIEGVVICNCVHVIVCLCHVRVTVHECL